MLEYDIGDRATCTEVAQCGQVRCAAGYKAIPGQYPQLFCDVPRGLFRASGCDENVCSPVGTLPGYIVANGPQCNRTSTCGAVTCAQGHNNNNGMNNPRVICPTDGGAMSGVGCLESVCLAPNSDLAQWQQDQPQIIIANMGCTTLDACGALSCAVGWSGTAQMQCLVPGQQFVVGGCVRMFHFSCSGAVWYLRFFTQRMIAFLPARLTPGTRSQSRRASSSKTAVTWPVAVASLARPT